MPPSDTRRRILDVALSMFNEGGLHRVGVREIARALEMSPGNLAYHFPTKDALVAALWRELHDLNSTMAYAAVAAAPADLVAWYGGIATGMRNHLRFRSLMMAYAEILHGNPDLRALEADLEASRRARHARALAALVRGGDLDAARTQDRGELHREQTTILMRGWLTLADDPERQLPHFAKVATALCEPLTTPAGQRTLERILAGEHDAEPAPAR